VGQYCSLAVIAGRPSIAYTNATIGDVRYIRAADANGVAWNAPQAIEAAVPVVQKQYTSLADIGGRIGLAYYVVPAPTYIHYWTSSDPDNLAPGSGSVTLDSGNRGQSASLKVVAGCPAVAYRGAPNTELRYTRSIDPDGLSWPSPIIVDAPTNVGLFVSMDVIGGRPAIAYYDQAAANRDMLYRRATDALGNTWGALERVDTAGIVGQYCCLAEVNGEPGISYYDATNGDLKFARYY
jgi:hypothetical protein